LGEAPGLTRPEYFVRKRQNDFKVSTVKCTEKPVISHLYFSKKNLLIFSLLTLFFLPLCSGAQAGTTKDIAWQILETKHTIVRYQSVADLTKCRSKVRFSEKHWGLKRLFASDESNSLETVIANRVDMVFEKVQQILGMRRRMKKVAINVYQNRDQLNEAYKSIYKRPCRIRAWYRYRNNTVYLNLSDLHERILAHELAYAIIDNSLPVRPPRATAKILARYVDSHLKRKVRSY
jgi:hypothetical protein